MNSTNNEFHILFDYAKKLRSRYLNTLAAFKIFERFNELSAPNKIGKRKAEINVKIFNNFKYFFLTIKETARCYFLIELAKFFDTHKKSLTIYKVINYAEKNLPKLSKQDFLSYHKGRQILPELFAQYKPLSLADLKKIKRRLNKNKSLIKKLKTYRDQYLAHDDIKKIKVKLTAREIKVLLNIVRSIIDLLYSKLDFSANSYINFEKQPIEELDKVMKNLIAYEQQRLEEIKKKYKI